MKKSFFPLLPIVILGLLLWQPGLAVSGARNGLILWANVILPTLLPFMLCSGAIVALGGVPLLVRPFFPVLSRLFSMSVSGCYVFLSGLLCGYPMGAKTCSEFLDSQMISPEEGRLLLAVSNHPSPMFLLGYAAAATLPSMTAPLLISVYLPVIPIALAGKYIYHVSLSSLKQPSALNKFSFDESLMNSVETMVKIGGYVMLFSIAAIFIQTLSPLSEKSSSFILGITEITTGIHAVSKSWPSETAGAVLAFITAFGGISGIFQTKSVLKNAGLSIRHYVLWKICHGTLSCGTFILLSQTEALASLLPL
ncbi:nucleoside recognition protein [Lachnoclostridium edouardi]|uniref:nucleoside recognition protein n=1 Tax=Lachnoclostridium edouardi TaxID=1926283 RepID=UPI000C798DC8|nr:nucleoside recognition protein [Lachnoclostridium edouardi]